MELEQAVTSALKEPTSSAEDRNEVKPAVAHRPILRHNGRNATHGKISLSTGFYETRECFKRRCRAESRYSYYQH